MSVGCLIRWRSVDRYSNACFTYHHTASIVFTQIFRGCLDLINAVKTSSRVTFLHQEQDVKSVSLSVIEESIEESLDTLDRAPSLDKDLGYEDSPRTRTQTASVQTSEHVSVIDKSRLREKSIQTTKQLGPLFSSVFADRPRPPAPPRLAVDLQNRLETVTGSL